MTDQDYLIHYGVLGMKWGVRKDKRSSGVNTLSRRKQKKLNRTQTAYNKRLNRFRSQSEMWGTSSENDKKHLSKISKMNTREYVKKTYGYDIADRWDRIEFSRTILSERGIKDPKELHKEDIEYAKQDLVRSNRNSERFKKIYEEYKNVKVENLTSSREAKKVAKKIKSKYK